MKSYIRKVLLNWLVKELFNGVDARDFLQIKSGILYVGKKPLEKKEAEKIIEQARLLQRLDLWDVMLKQLYYKANQTMFEKSKTYDDMYFGKAMLLCTYLLESKVAKLSQHDKILNK
jgi:hypothetical protein